MVSHVFMADVGHSGQILSYADSAWSCVGNDMPCLLCVARRDFDLIEVEKPPAFRPLSRTPAQVHFFFFFFFGTRSFLFYTFVLCRRLRHVVCRDEGLLSSTSDSIVNLNKGGFACDTSLPHYWRMFVIFCVSPCDSISSSGSVIGNRALCAGSVAGQHCCSSMELLC